MLDVCLKYADKVYVTSDNPRYENPNDIIKDVIRNKMSYKVKPRKILRGFRHYCRFSKNSIAFSIGKTREYRKPWI